ncbi:hypothetical protein G3N18_05040 [Microbacterium sp. 2C]|uniref:hypothetical protein n=2 Tax=Microbacterium TaxID=33882 RepID=UPI0018C29379|nr:hypothetical protein [Microbacterium paulum]MBG0717453.1 hypothetical protein [Microbacterium paulum]
MRVRVDETGQGEPPAPVDHAAGRALRCVLICVLIDRGSGVDAGDPAVREVHVDQGRFVGGGGAEAYAADDAGGGKREVIPPCCGAREAEEA